MGQDAGRLYGWLYDKGTAATLVLLSGLLLATGQTRTIVDAVVLVHPGWSPAWAWIVAVGFETAILSVGLVMASTGDRDLWRWEVILVGASVAAGLAVGLHGHVLQDYGAWARGIAMGFLPVQYLAVVLTGHKLADAGRKAEREAAPIRDPAAPRVEIEDGTGGPSALKGVTGLTLGPIAEPGPATWAAGPGWSAIQGAKTLGDVTLELSFDDALGRLTGTKPKAPLGFAVGAAAEGPAGAAVARKAPGRGKRAPDVLALLTEAPEGLGVQARDAWVAERMGISAKTVQRQRAAAGL